MITLLGPDGRLARAGISVTCVVSGKRRDVGVIKANRKTVLVRVPATTLRPAKIIKRHVAKHAVGGMCAS